MIRVLLALGLVGCTLPVTGDGSVYRCGSLELCYVDDSAEALSGLTGVTCSYLTERDRYGSELGEPIGVACWYRCPPTPGCNAHDGCYCGG